MPANAVGNSGPVSVTVTIDPDYNRAPICSDNGFPGRKPVARGVATWRCDLDRAAASTPTVTRCCSARAFIGRPTSGGTLLCLGLSATLSYTSPAGFTGADTFTFFAADDRGAHVEAP